MSRFQLHVTLRQQTPLIHFQHDQEGACLRASEVKPKLDRFLTKQGITLHLDWFLRETKALDYKLRFETEEDPQRSDTGDTDIHNLRENLRGKDRRKPNRPIGSSYFGNMATQPKDASLEEKIENIEAAYKETVFYTQSIRMIFFCRHPELLDTIKTHIALFFLLHNFGTRQSKGFGSFKVAAVAGREITQSVLEILDAQAPFYYIKYTTPPNAEHSGPMRDIAELYQLMKSGRNVNKPYQRAYIYQYMSAKNIGNEKGWMKHNGVSPVVFRPANATRGEHVPPRDTYKYVRAVLGVGDQLKYFTHMGAAGRAEGAKMITISHAAKTIDRFPSPVFFKIADEYLVIFPYEPDARIYNQTFTFDGLKKGTIATPDKSEFTMSAFMSDFVRWFGSGKVTDLSHLHIKPYPPKGGVAP